MSYCKESLELTDNKPHVFGVPMVSFCDLKLSELKLYIQKYGHYGIGLSKVWAMKKMLNPVFYVNKNSEFATMFDSSIKILYNEINGLADENLDYAYNGTVNTFRFMKNYQGNDECQKVIQGKFVMQ